ncbi:MAG: hypothetical protein R2774_01355 [Saprospiraceae bacterium]
MDTKKVILGLSLIIGLVLFIFLGYTVLREANPNEFQKTIFAGLFTAIGASIAVLLDVNLQKDTNVKTGMFRTIGSAVQLTENNRFNPNYLGLVYAATYFIIGVITIFKAGGDDEFITTIASSFGGILLAIIGKYAISK